MGRFMMLCWAVLLVGCAGRVQTPVVVYLPTATATATVTSTPTSTATPTVELDSWTFGTSTPTAEPLRVQFDITDEEGRPVAADVWLVLIYDGESQDFPIEMGTTSVDFVVPGKSFEAAYITVWASGYLLWNDRIPPEGFRQAVISGTVVLEKLE